MVRCEEKRKERAKHWQCDAEAQDVQGKPWRLFFKKIGGRNAKVDWQRRAVRQRQESAVMVFISKSLWMCRRKRKEKYWNSPGRWNNVVDDRYQLARLLLLIPTSEGPIALLPAMTRWWEGLRAQDVTQ